VKSVTHLPRTLGLLLAMLLAACASNTAGQDSPPPAPPTQPTAELPVNDAGVPLVARVNSQEITLPEFQQAVAQRQTQMDAADTAALQESVLDVLIQQAVIEQYAAAQQISVTDAEVQTELQSYKTESSNWDEWLRDNGMTEAEFAQELRDSMITERVRDQVTQSVAGALLHVHARHILVSTEAEANEVLSRLQAGEDFAALAAQYSKDVTTKDSGGDLGWFTQEELLEPALAQVAFSLQPGQIAGPVPTRLGYHILQTLEFAQRPVPPEKQADLAQVAFENWLQAQLDSATVERYF